MIARLHLWAYVALFVVSLASKRAAGEAPDFERSIAPLISKHCLGCHNASEAKGEFVLTTRKAALAGGDTGPAIVPGKPDESYLLQRVADGEMPPEDKGESRQLPDEEVALLRAWIAAGAPWPEERTLTPYEATTDARAGLDWWSLQPVQRPPVPPVRGADRVANPIDAFLVARLEGEGMTWAPPADRRALMRRVYFDLVGLPPTPDAARAFVEDDSPSAYERLIDELLASPHYGERWGRYWLDLVRYADTNGYERDVEKPFSWKYRDWVIRSFNDDKPYDRFVVEQLAGDELPDRSEETVAATGMLRAGTWDDEPNDALEYKYERLEDLVHVTSTAFLGVTVKCARCHDHKFDPIGQSDYYRMASIFWAGFIEERDRPLMGGPSYEELGYELLGWTDRGREVPPLHLLKKGDPLHPGEVVEPGFLSMVPALDRALTTPPTEAKTTHRRLQLARWIVDRRNPLTARVMVNRLWQHHFGLALVRTPNNFGRMGDPPTHPELLDWLASELVDGGWKIKRLHKLMLMSAAYRQASVHPEQAKYDEKDPGNRLWWHAQRRRLDAEAMRDALLASSGRLQLKMGGPGFFPEVSEQLLAGLSRKGEAWGTSTPDERSRRSIYLFTKRSLLLPLMTTFDFADTSQPCGARDVTTVAPQALALLNNQFVHEMSQTLARRLTREAGPNRAEQIRRAWWLTLTREPTPAEAAAALAHIETQQRHFAQRLGEGDLAQNQAQSQALASLCHVLVNANEFLYVD